MHQQTWDSCSFDIICPQDKILTPYPQSMKTFQKVRSNRYKNYWVEDITDHDLNTLPIILLGLSDIKLFPIPTDNVSKKLMNGFPHIQFFDSKITGRKLAAGTTTFNSPVNGVPRKPINIMWDYQEIKDDQELDQTEETVIQVNYNLNETQTNEAKDFILELDDQVQSLSDIINHPGTDTERKKF